MSFGSRKRYFPSQWPLLLLLGTISGVSWSAMNLKSIENVKSSTPGVNILRMVVRGS